METPNEGGGGARRRNWDAYAAMVATLIGLLALLVSAYTAHLQRQQLRAQVWPYLSIATANVAPDIGFHVTNSGTGPARVIAARIRVDHHLVTTWGAVHKAVGGRADSNFIYADLTHAVMSPGKDLTILRPLNAESAPSFVELYLGTQHELGLEVCYCSVLDECWLTASDDDARVTAIGGPDDCPIPAGERFKQ
ncbi:MAG TPA: hypothetical protein VFP84_23150 [Kofleriaceae bacterium]|nr:hypothetical protein [Kofleriaceae bacterium]